MGAIREKTKYNCNRCGQVHDEWPALAFKSPDNYDTLSVALKESITEIDDDFCVIKYSDQTDRFIRCTLTQKVNDHCEDLEYGLWVSLSEKSYDDYLANFNNEHQETTYFGWLSNTIPEYAFKESIPTTIVTRTGNQRPEIIPHKNFDHPFVKDYYNGISKLEAEKRIDFMLNRVQEIDSTPNKKSWWKIW